MTLRTITATITDPAGEPDNTEWVFISELRGADGKIITTRPKTVKPVAGLLTVQLEPGPTIAQFGGRKLTILVPDEDADLWELLEAAIAYPPDTSQQQLNSAVGQYVESNSAQFRTRAVPVDPDDPDTLYQWVDANGDEVGDPVELVDIVAVGWGAIEGMPAEVGAGGTKAEAREAIDAVGGSTVATAVDGQDTTVADGVLKAKNPTYIDPTAAPYNVKMDRYTTTAASMSSSTNPTQLTVSGYTFTAADIGKVIKVGGAGAAGANLKTAITGATAGKAVLASPCLTTVSNAYAVFGTDNHDALQALFTDLSFGGRGRKLARTAIFPAGACLFSGTLVFPRRGTIKGAAENFVSHDIIYGARGDAAEDTGGTVFHQMWDQNCDGFNFPDPLYDGDVWWNGKLHGFAVLQDDDNTAGKGINFVNSDGDPVTIIDGGQVDYVSVLGWAEEGFNFAGGSLPGTFKYLLAFACGYEARKDFTCDTTSGNQTLTNVSDTTGLAAGDILTGPGIPIDAVISSVNVGANTVSMNRIATASGTGVAVQRLGAPGIRYKIWGDEPVHFDCPSGDQNSGGTLRIVGPSGTYGPAILITSLKNECGTNVYRESRLDSVTFDGNYSVPQGLNAVVLDGPTRAKIKFSGLSHWGDASSSVGGTYPNPLGRDLGAAILDLNNGGSAPDVTWEALTVRAAPSSGQANRYAYRDSRSSTYFPIEADLTGKGTNRRKGRYVRAIADTAATITPQDSIVVWSSLTAARTGTLPLISAVEKGTEITLMDDSGSASGSLTITAVPGGSDTIVGSTQVNSAYGRLDVISDGTRWIGKAALSNKVDIIRDTNGVTMALLTAAASAVNYLGLQNAATSSPPQVKAQGGDTNISLMLVPKGTGGIQIYTGTGVHPRLTANGADTNLDLLLESKGTGVVKANGVEVVTLTGTQTLTLKTLTGPKIATIKDANGNTALNLPAVASAVNYPELQGAAASGAVILAAKGTDTNIHLMVQPKGTGALQIYAGAGVTPRLLSTGADTDVGLNLATKGAGTVQANGNPVGVKVAVPGSASATGVPGQWAADASYHYDCVATNTWVRTAVATW